tara:strand:+ start:708 stop:827 length:120 start_codon:yes stop_codon:yes gene_type:complete
VSEGVILTQIVDIVRALSDCGNQGVFIAYHEVSVYEGIK